MKQKENNRTFWPIHAIMFDLLKNIVLNRMVSFWSNCHNFQKLWSIKNKHIFILKKLQEKKKGQFVAAIGYTEIILSPNSARLSSFFLRDIIFLNFFFHRCWYTMDNTDSHRLRFGFFTHSYPFATTSQIEQFIFFQRWIVYSTFITRYIVPIYSKSIFTSSFLLIILTLVL